jgi:hypothetical protein
MTTRLPRANWRCAAGPRCPGCGGICDPVEDHGQGSRP